MLFGFLVLAHDRRRVLHFNGTANPTAEWTTRQVMLGGAHAGSIPEALAPVLHRPYVASFFGNFLARASLRFAADGFLACAACLRALNSASACPVRPCFAMCGSPC